MKPSHHYVNCCMDQWSEEDRNRGFALHIRDHGGNWQQYIDNIRASRKHHPEEPFPEWWEDLVGSVED